MKEYGLNTLADLHGYKFERMAGLLHFRQLKPLAQITAGKSRHFAHAIEHCWRRVNGSVAGYPFGWLKFERKPDGAPRHGGRAKALKYNAHTISPMMNSTGSCASGLLTSRKHFGHEIGPGFHLDLADLLA